MSAAGHGMRVPIVTSLTTYDIDFSMLGGGAISGNGFIWWSRAAGGREGSNANSAATLLHKAKVDFVTRTSVQVQTTR